MAIRQVSSGRIVATGRVASSGRIGVADTRVHLSDFPASALTASLDGASDYFLTVFGSYPATADNVKPGTISLWFKRATTGIEALFYNSGRIAILFTATNEIRVTLDGTDNAAKIDVSTTTQFTDTGWHHFYLSWDLANTTYVAYVDGTAETMTETVPPVDDVIEWRRGTYSLGATQGGASLFAGCLSEVFISLEYITDIAKFRTSGGKPKDLGADGSEPTGTAPLFYFNKTGTGFGQDQSGNSNDLAAVGAPAICSSSPAD